MKTATTSEVVSFEDFKKEVINDYKIARISRECSLLGRKEVLTGKAKFGIFGDGKEVPQLALAKAFQKPTQAICEPLWAICGRGFNSDNKKAVVNLHKYQICSS